MDPNSQNQWWSKWTFTVRPGIRGSWTLDDVKANCARFGRKAFGSGSQMRVTVIDVPKAQRNHPGLKKGLKVEVLTEGHPVHDPRFEEVMGNQWRAFFVAGFGAGTTTDVKAELKAGSWQDGRPAEQLLMIKAETLWGLFDEVRKMRGVRPPGKGGGRRKRRPPDGGGDERGGRGSPRVH